MFVAVVFICKRWPIFFFFCESLYLCVHWEDPGFLERGVQMYNWGGGGGGGGGGGVRSCNSIC